MQVKSIAECSKGEHSAILSTFIELPVLRSLFFSIFEWPFYTGLTVHVFQHRELIPVTFPYIYKVNVIN